MPVISWPQVTELAFYVNNQEIQLQQGCDLSNVCRWSAGYSHQFMAALSSNPFLIFLYNYNKVSNLQHQSIHRLLSLSHFPPFSDFVAD
jgi:uncharacterized Zn finger protein